MNERLICEESEKICNTSALECPYCGGYVRIEDILVCNGNMFAKILRCGVCKTYLTVPAVFGCTGKDGEPMSRNGEEYAIRRTIARGLRPVKRTYRGGKRNSAP